ncbi:MAG: hypothetical protein ACFFHV_18900 [Promethearchaeota archaeon]
MLMQVIEFVDISLNLVWIVLQLIVGAFLSYKMFKTKQYNLIPLILFFVINSVRLFVYQFTPYLIIYLILIQFPNILLLIFIKTTFFKDKKSPFKFFLIILIIVRTIDLLIRLQYGITIPMRYPLRSSHLIFYYYILFSITIAFLLSHLWLGLVSIRYYKSIQSINIEPWIKKRYQIIGIASITYSLSIFLYYFFPYDEAIKLTITHQNPFISLLILLITGFTIFYSLCMFFAWVMPNRLKSHFNKDFQSISDKEFEENELLELIKKELNNK